MPATTFPEYVWHMTALLNQAVVTGETVLSACHVDQRSAVRGLIAGILQFGGYHRCEPSRRLCM